MLSKHGIFPPEQLSSMPPRIEASMDTYQLVLDHIPTNKFVSAGHISRLIKNKTGKYVPPDRVRVICHKSGFVGKHCDGAGWKYIRIRTLETFFKKINTLLKYN
jgi:hypothetical protein